MAGVSRASARIENSHGRRAMTLLEVMVVMAMLLLLVALLLPGLSRARKAADRLRCASNLRAMGNALTVVKCQTGSFPLRDPPIPDQETFSGLEHVSTSVVLQMLEGTLDHPSRLYCPTSIREDVYAKPATIKLGRGQAIHHWKTGQISYMYLAGVRNHFADAQGRPTFIPKREAPDIKRNANAVLAGDRVVERRPDTPHVPGSNHGREGGWFFFVAGNAKWYSWQTLTAHPSNSYTWYFPRTSPSQ